LPFIVLRKFFYTHKRLGKDFEALTSVALQKNIPVYIVTASLNEAAIALQKPFFKFAGF
jgi:hypothetical protein